MLRYNTKVRVISDPENDGFYIGLEGVLKERSIKEGVVRYAIEFDNPLYFWVKEDEVELL